MKSDPTLETGNPEPEPEAGLRGRRFPGGGALTFPYFLGNEHVALEDTARSAYQRGTAQLLLAAGEIGVEVHDDHALRVLDADHSLGRRRERRDLRGDRSWYGAGRGDAYRSGHGVRLVAGFGN